jgi:hypothetical protein
MHLVNITLNNDFDGGGLFFVKLPVIQDKEAVDGYPIMLDEYRDYDWLSRQMRQNASEIIFPTLGTGDLLIYNYTLYRGVALVEAGTHYYFVLFYDMDNPAIQVDSKVCDFTAIWVRFYHKIKDIEISHLFVNTHLKGHPTVVIKKYMHPFKEYPQYTYVRHVFQAVIRRTNTIVSEFVMSDNQSLYTVEAYYSNYIAVKFYHEIKYVETCLLFVNTHLKGQRTVVIKEYMHPFKEYPQYTYAGHVFCAVIRGTNTIVSEFVMSDNQSMYTVEAYDSNTLQ